MSLYGTEWRERAWLWTLSNEIQRKTGLQQGLHKNSVSLWSNYTVFKGTLIKKKNEIFLVYKAIQMGSVAKSYMRKGFLIYEEMCKYLTICEEAIGLNFLTIFMRKILFYCLSAYLCG
jgi:hypothetical protein